MQRRRVLLSAGAHAGRIATIAVARKIWIVDSRETIVSSRLSFSSALHWGRRSNPVSQILIVSAPAHVFSGLKWISNPDATHVPPRSVSRPRHDAYRYAFSARKSGKDQKNKKKKNHRRVDGEREKETGERSVFGIYTRQKKIRASCALTPRGPFGTVRSNGRTCYESSVKRSIPTAFSVGVVFFKRLFLHIPSCVFSYGPLLSRSHRVFDYGSRVTASGACIGSLWLHVPDQEHRQPLSDVSSQAYRISCILIQRTLRRIHYDAINEITKRWIELMILSVTGEITL